MSTPSSSPLVRMHVRELGEGSPIVLVHGFPGNAGDFDAMAALLARDHRVLVPDLLGFGASTTPEGSLWIDRQAEALRQALSERGVVNPVVVGHDVGGPVAAWLASTTPVRALVIASCSLVGDPPLPPPFRLLRTPLVGRWMEALLFSGAALRLLGRFASRGRSPAVNSPSEVRSIRRIFGTALRDLPGHYAELERRLATLTMPSAFVVGERDPFFRGAFAERMAALLPSRRLEVLRGCGHFPQLERPRELALIVEELASGAPRTSSPQPDSSTRQPVA